VSHVTANRSTSYFLILGRCWWYRGYWSIIYFFYQTGDKIYFLK